MINGLQRHSSAIVISVALLRQLLFRDRKPRAFQQPRHRTRAVCRRGWRSVRAVHQADPRSAGETLGTTLSDTSAADLKFLHHLQETRLGTSNRKATLEL